MLLYSIDILGAFIRLVAATVLEGHSLIPRGWIVGVPQAFKGLVGDLTHRFLIDLTEW
jgi:hypothetical protein